MTISYREAISPVTVLPGAIVNDLAAGGIGQALSAQAGKELNETKVGSLTAVGGAQDVIKSGAAPIAELRTLEGDGTDLDVSGSGPDKLKLSLLRYGEVQELLSKNDLPSLATSLEGQMAVTPDGAFHLRSKTRWVSSEPVSGAITLQGTWDATTGAFPAGALKGYLYLVTGSATVDGQDFSLDMHLTALVDNPSTTTIAGNWLVSGGASVAPTPTKIEDGLTRVQVTPDSIEFVVQGTSALKAYPLTDQKEWEASAIAFWKAPAGGGVDGDFAFFFRNQYGTEDLSTDNQWLKYGVFGTYGQGVFFNGPEGIYMFDQGGALPNGSSSMQYLQIDSNGRIHRRTSSLKRKSNVRDFTLDNAEVTEYLGLRSVKFDWKGATDARLKNELGVIAEEADVNLLTKSGTTYWRPTRGADEEIDGFDYETLTILNREVLRNLVDRIEVLESAAV